jgi:hypothetical protein
MRQKVCNKPQACTPLNFAMMSKTGLRLGEISNDSDSARSIERESRTLATPVAFFIFNRPALTEKVFSRIAQAKPPTLLVVADGPRSEEETTRCEETRRIINRVDWECRVFEDFSDRNLGCKTRVSTGLDWVFSQVEEAIILEDDCLPAPTFFTFCEELLEHYRDDERVFLISGDNFQFGQPRIRYSYYFSRYAHCWGWASWKRAWKHFDVTMSSWPEFKSGGYIKSICENPAEQKYWSKIFDDCYNAKIDSWAYVWLYACWSQGGLTILPDRNLVSNIGFGADATHTGGSATSLASLPTGDIWKIQHPKLVGRYAEADAFTFKNVFQL